jgi:HEAT repeat protein
LSPGILPRPRMTAGQLAAASALGRLGSPAARAVLTKGARSLNPKVRDAVRR